jgi:tetratricopeptide (TPR) repeat protein
MITTHKPLHWSFVICSALLFSLLTGCHSAKPPPPRPPTLDAAERATSEAEKYTQQQNWTLAARMWQEAANQYALLNNQPRLAIAWHNLAEANTHLNKLAEAEPLLERAAKINQHLGRTNEWWRNQIALLQVRALAQKTNELQAQFQKLIAMQPKDPYLQGLFVNELGLWEQSRGDFNKAEQNFRKAEQLFTGARSTNGVATVFANLAALKEAQKEYPAALDLWRTALTRFEALADPRGITDALAGLGRTYLQIGKDFPAAEGYLRHAAENYQTLKLPKLRGKTLEYLAQTLARQGHETEAAAMRNQAQELLR